MLAGLTRREQRILLLLIITIALGMAIHRLRNGSQREIICSSPHTENNNKKESEPAGFSEESPSSQTLLININIASLEELCSLHGIGEVKAKAIIKYRDDHDGFKILEEIMKVPGIGTSTFQKIRERITTGSENSPKIESKPESKPTFVSETSVIGEEKKIPVDPTGKVDINTAGLEELMTLEQIGEVKAQRIMDYRSRYGPFRSVKDLLKIRGIGEKTLLLNRDRIIINKEGPSK